MKIVLVGRYGEGEILSGPEKVAKNIFSQISILNPNSKFLTYFFKSGKRRKAKVLIFGSETISTNPSICRFGIFKLASEIIKNKPDLVHLVTFERFELIVVFLKFFLKFKLVYTIHGIYKYERKIFYRKPKLLSDIKDLFLEKLIVSNSDTLIFLSTQMFKLAQDYYKLNESKVNIIPNGVSIPSVSKENIFDLSNGVDIVFYNGLVDSRERGLEKLIKVLSEGRLNNFHLSVLGKPIKMDLNNVTFHSPMQDNLLFDFLINQHVFIDNLDYMPFSILALEAMALGLILIVSSESGILSYINNGENGFIYNSEKPEEIGIILSDILAGKYDLNNISQNAKKIYLQLNWQDIATEYTSAYKKVL